MSALFESTAFIVVFEIVPAVLALILAVLLWMNPMSRGLIWKLVLAWVVGVAVCFWGVGAFNPSFGLLAYVLILFCPWIGVAMLAIAWYRAPSPED